MKKFLIGIIANKNIIDCNDAHTVNHKYIRALNQTTTQLVPLIIPAMGTDNMKILLNTIDGLMLTGSSSNIHPKHYQHSENNQYAPFDHQRDKTTIPYIQNVVEHGIPLLAICRGLQELNVAFGGSLTPAIHELPDHFDHRMPESKDLNIRMMPRHKVTLVPHGLFSSWTKETTLYVNSLHHQAIDRLADNLVIEAIAEDGIIEGVSVKNALGFTAAVQWHPEYKANENPFSSAMYKAFETAVIKKSTERY